MSYSVTNKSRYMCCSEAQPHQFKSINPIDSKVQKSDVTTNILSYLICDPFTINELMEVRKLPFKNSIECVFIS